MYFLGRPVALFSGMDLVTRVNNMEFTMTGAGTTEYDVGTNNNNNNNNKTKETTKRPKGPKVFGSNNLMFEKNKARHLFLRQLIGSAMTPKALVDALPTIQQTAKDVIEQQVLKPMMAQSAATIKMEDVCVDYTMDIVRNQLLGLQLAKEEANDFREKLKDWMKGLFSIAAILRIPFLVTRSKPYKAKVFIESKLEEKIDSLLRDGPDSSTLSNMVFAIDDDKQQLSREDVVQNALLLVSAGAETSAGTLTLAMLLLGVHPDKFRKLVQEQQVVVENHGTQLTPSILDKECPYLDAVVKETLRIGPITGGFPRRVKDTFVIDGVQIPKDWSVFTSYRLTHQLDPVTALPNDAHMDVYQGFQPDRWIDPATTPSDFVPFGAGPRFCLGYHLSMMEMKVFLAIFARSVTSFHLQNYSAETKRPIKWNPSTIIPRPTDGVELHSIVEMAAESSTTCRPTTAS
ncbi:hydroxyvitamin D-1 alpha hydroxylase, mitochondrial [Seminavis robusta]|uniref:Hydroxyvitamin D-1 alpha hydroxylase, mitochondrial n=1 Tax=Seminavis robusta TaxID=568900 RepID=A0A9N8EAC3_9STRA|nr:hydroxyvitamin D-1 alpha hydroxylase, mitochondrial [Seminavis robusta]|eukprot:Sro684_g186720.1 hydroxyvitamin D-1 alpha hydroxylase, mitochondrial (459) ;mRNA; r:12428-13804